MSDFIFQGSKITADGDCSHEIKRRLLLGRKVIPSPLLIASGGSIPLLCLQGVPELPGAPQDEAGLPRKFET